MGRYYQHKNDENIIIKEGDKGSTLVIMDCKYYKSVSYGTRNDENSKRMNLRKSYKNSVL